MNITSSHEGLYYRSDRTGKTGFHGMGVRGQRIRGQHVYDRKDSTQKEI